MRSLINHKGEIFLKVTSDELCTIQCALTLTRESGEATAELAIKAADVATAIGPVVAILIKAVASSTAAKMQKQMTLDEIFQSFKYNKGKGKK